VFLAGSALAADKSEKKAKKRAEIDAVAATALKEVLSKSPNAKALYDKAYGYAVFDNLKIAFGISGGGGSGVAVPKSGKRVYMKMGTAGVGFGLGGQKYQVVFLFETEQTFKSFVDKGWQADASAQAAAADKGANVGATFKNGVAYYQLTDKGLMASADITGTKYWKTDDLNE
jgi:lipid-binding SYLF domain-containing protein